MKKILFSLLLAAGILTAGTVAAQSILKGQQGGTGYGTTTPGNVGNCLSVATANPITYIFSGCSGGSGSGSVNGTGAPGFVARWSSNATITTGSLLDTGTVAGVNATSSAVNFNIQGSGSRSALLVSSSTGATLLQVRPLGDTVLTVTDKGGQVYNVKAYGAVVDGTTDDTAAIQLAIDTATSTTNGGIIMLGAGTSSISSLVLGDNITLMGWGKTASTLKARNTTTPFVIYDPTANSGIQMRNFSLYGLGKTAGGSQIGISLGASNLSTILANVSDIYVDGFPGNCFYLGSSISSSVDRYNGRNCGDKTFYAQNGTSLNINLGYAQSTVYSGWYIEGITYGSMTNASAEYTNYGFYFKNVRNYVINAPGMEQTKNSSTTVPSVAAYVFDGGRDITFNAGYSTGFNSLASSSAWHIIATNSPVNLAINEFRGVANLGGPDADVAPTGLFNFDSGARVTARNLDWGGEIGGGEYGKIYSYETSGGFVGVGTSTQLGFLHVVNTSTQASLLAVTSGGNVGIGTSTPGQKLVIQGAEAHLVSAAGSTRQFVLGTSIGGNRWSLRANNTTESGSNAGSDFNICRYNDAGTVLDCPLGITRSSGRVGIGSSTPQAAILTVVGTAGSAGNLFVVASSSNSAWVTVAASGSTTLSTLANALPVRSTSGGSLFNGPINAASELFGVTPVANGGTGTSTLPTVQGQILAADGTGTKFAPANLVAGSNITITTTTPGQITITSTASGGSGATTTINGVNGPTFTFATGSSGTLFNIATSSGTVTFNLPYAATSTNGQLYSYNWSSFWNGLSPFQFQSFMQNSSKSSYATTTYLFEDFKNYTNRWSNTGSGSMVFTKSGVMNLTTPTSADVVAVRTLWSNILRGFDTITFDINLNGNTFLVAADTPQMSFDQSGDKGLILTNFVANGSTGWQTVTIPLTKFTSNLDSTSSTPGTGTVLATSSTVSNFKIRVYENVSGKTLSIRNVVLSDYSHTLREDFTQPDLMTRPKYGNSALRFQGMDFMKVTKDNMTSQYTDTQMSNLLSATKPFNLTHIAVSMPYDDVAAYLPTSTVVSGYADRWARAIRGAGYSLFWRQHWNGWEGDYSFPKTATSTVPLGTAAGVLNGTDTTSYLYKNYNYILTHASQYAPGDIITPVAEPENGGINGITSCTNSCQFYSGNEFRQFLMDNITITNAALDRIGLKGRVYVGYYGTSGFIVWGNGGNPKGFLDDRVADAMGIVTVDHYPNPVTDLTADLLTYEGIYNQRPLIITEYGTTNETSTATKETAINFFMDTIKAKPYIWGFNYWSATGGSNEDVIDSSTLQVKGGGAALIAQFTSSASQIIANLLGNGGTYPVSLATSTPPIRGQILIASTSTQAGWGDILPGTNLLTTTSTPGQITITVTSTPSFTGLTVTGSTTIGSLTASNCDVKATLAGGLYCGTDATGGGGTVSGGQTGWVTTWASSTGLTFGTLIDNGTVAGVNATSSTVNFNIQGSGTRNPLNVASSSGTSMLQVTAGGLTVFGGLSTAAYTQGGLFYDTANQSLTFYNDNSNVALQIGQEEYVRAWNNTGATIANAAAVYITTGTTTYPYLTVGLAYASSTEAIAAAVGLATADCATNTICIITTYGTVRGVNTSAYAAGTILYLSSTTAGSLASTSPSSPSFRVYMAKVGNSSSTGGTLFVQPARPAMGSCGAGQLVGSNTTGTGNECKILVNGSNITITTSTPGQITVAATGGSGNSAWTIGNGLIYNATSTDLVGIGTSAPTTTLFIQGKGGTNPFAIASSTGTQMVTVTQAGNVGIGTTTPRNPLVVVGNATFKNEATAINNANGGYRVERTNDDSVLYGGFRSTPDAWIIGASYTSTGAFKPLAFATSDLERVRIDTGGNVGIGSTTPTALLVVQGSGTNTELVRVASSSNATILSVSASSTPTYALQVLRSNAADLFTVKVSDNTVNINTSTSTFATLNVNGAVYSTYWWVECAFPTALAGLTGDSSSIINFCPPFLLDEDGQAATAALNAGLTRDGTQAIEMFAGATAVSSAAVASGDGAAVTMGTGSGLMGFTSATNTPIFEVFLNASSTNATSTLFMAGMGSSISGADWSVKPTSGYYFVASSTTGNWQAAAQEISGAISLVDTGVSSTTPLFTWQKMNIVITMSGGSATGNYYINDLLVATITPAQTAAKSGLNPFVSVGATANGLAKNLRWAGLRVGSKIRP